MEDGIVTSMISKVEGETVMHQKHGWGNLAAGSWYVDHDSDVVMLEPETGTMGS